MKRFLIFVIAAVLSLLAVSCVDEKPVEQAPVISLSATQISLGSTGTVQKIVYEVKHAVEGNAISVVNEADWLTVDVSNQRVIEVSAQKNEAEDVREALFTVSYPGAEDVVVTVTQMGWKSGSRC